MRNPKTPWVLAALLPLVLLASSCHDATSDAINGVQRQTEPGITLTAEPTSIELDPNDPNAPRDPNTNKLIGSTQISAIVRGAEGVPQAGAEVTFTTTAGTLASGGTPVVTDANGLAQDTLSVDEDNAGDVTVTAASGEFTGTVVVPVVVVPLNAPPVADAGDDQTVECPSPVTLDGSGSTDPDSTEGTNDDIVLFEWFLGETKIATGEVVEVELPAGTHVVTLKVTDETGATATDDVTVTVNDTEPPVVSLRMSPATLWPPNHKMRDVRALLEVEDCDPAPTVELVSVTSNEPENGTGDGDTSPDFAGADVGGDDRRLQLRAERSGNGSGRIYTIVYRVTDASGNSTEATSVVRVPHDQGH